MIDVEAERARTPGAAHVAHLNNAGAALPAAPVTDAVIAHLHLEARLGGVEAAASAHEAVERPYDAIAALIGADRDEIALTDSATRAWDLALSGFTFEPGDRILTGHAEYGSNAIAMLDLARRTGAVLEVVDDDGSGQVDVTDLRRRLAAGPAALVALVHVPTQSGLVNPAAAVGTVCREAGVPYLLDACQAVGQLPVDVREIGCDLLSATGRKWLRAPRGTGFLYVSTALGDRIAPRTPDMRGATWTAPGTYHLQAGARRFELWERNVAAQIGLGVAVDDTLRVGVPVIAERVGALAATLRTALRDVPGVTMRDRGAQLCGIVTFTLAGSSAEHIRDRLRGAGVNVSVSYATSAQFDFPARGLSAVVRASPHYYNTETELRRLVDALPAAR